MKTLLLSGPKKGEAYSTIEEARALTETDPAIQVGSLVMELRPWYGSAALMTVNDMHPRLAKKPI